MSRTNNRSDPPTAAEMREGLARIPIGIVVCATVLPGFTLCVSG